MSDDLQEFRFDIPLPIDATPQHFERGWRSLLAAQHLTALAMPPSQAVSARFRLCNHASSSRSLSHLMPYVTARLSALPGTPQVAVQADQDDLDWQGVKIWLSYHATDLVDLLKKPKSSPRVFPHRGRRQ